MIALRQASSATGLTKYCGAQFSLLSYCFATGLICNRSNLQQASPSVVHSLVILLCNRTPLQQASSATGLICNGPCLQQALYATGLTKCGTQFSLLSYCFATGLLCNQPPLQQASSARGLICKKPNQAWYPF